MTYRCLRCGSSNGEPVDEANENWFWRVVAHGRIGPFCSRHCNDAFVLAIEPTFTLAEWDRLHFLRWRYTQGLAGDFSGRRAERGRVRMPSPRYSE